MSNLLAKKRRQQRIELLKGLSNQQLIDELRRRRNITADYELTWIHKGAFYNTGESVAEVAKKVSEEAEQEAKDKELKEKLKTA